MSQISIAEPCPICNRASRRSIRSYTPKEAAQAFLPRNITPRQHQRVVEKLNKIWYHNECHILACDNCTFVFSAPFTSGDAEFYELISPATPYPKRKWEFDRTLQTLRSLDLKSLDVIEVGAGSGVFLQMLKDHGCPTEHLFATEFSSTGRKAIAERGIACSPEDVRRLDPERKFDVVCMFQVLEHLDDFQGLFDALRRITKPGAQLFVAVPYGEWIARNERVGLLLDVPPNHISRWWPRSLECLAERFGWTIAGCEIEPANLRLDMANALASRFLRKARAEKSWENHVLRLAEKVERPALARMIKLAGAATSFSCLATVIGLLLDGPVSHHVWVHLQRPKAR
jgi:2-polyprenyl-3-methyl-5-hydroxy-6-metoxy-1,4-benzoquinol methylase